MSLALPIAVSLAALSAVIVPPAGAASAVTITTGGANGVGRINSPACRATTAATGRRGTTATRRRLPAGVFSELAHRSAHEPRRARRRRSAVASPPRRTGSSRAPRAPSPSSTSAAPVVLRLHDGGDCDDPTAAVDPTSVPDRRRLGGRPGRGLLRERPRRRRVLGRRRHRPRRRQPLEPRPRRRRSRRPARARGVTSSAYWGKLGLDLVTRRPSVTCG